MQKSTAVRTAAALWKQRKELRRRIRLMYKRNCFPLSYVYIILHMQQHCKFLPNKKAASNLAAFVYYKLKSSPVFPVSVSSFPASGIPNAAAITSPRLDLPAFLLLLLHRTLCSPVSRKNFLTPLSQGYQKSLLLLPLRCCLADT